MKLLIDADILVYRCGFAAENEKEFFARYNARSQLYKMFDETAVFDYQLFLTGKNNFREKEWSLVKYKGNREKLRKPKHYDALRKYLVDEWNALIIEGKEADDALATAQVNDETIICSIDKDLDMVPGWHYNFVKKNKYYITKLDGLINFYAQILSGDAVDNIPGLPGMGKIKAQKALKDLTTEEELQTKVRELYLSKAKEGKIALKSDVVIDITKLDDALNEIGILLWMQRHDQKEPKKFTTN